MRMLSFTKYASLDDLQIIEVERPEPKANEVLVKIHASSINSWDWELFNAQPFANRLMFGLFRPKRLKTLGIDIAGSVESIGSEVSRFRVGDDVYGDLSAVGWGGFAEYVAVAESALESKPTSISFVEAAAVPQAALLAWQGLVDVGKIQAGQQVLINGASGGSGTFAIQIAKHFGAEITATCRGNKMEFVKALGADHVLDYTQQNYTQMDRQYDLIIDAQAHYPLSQVKRALKPNGIYALHGGASGVLFESMVTGPIRSRLGSRKYRVVFHRANSGLTRLSDLMLDGKIKPIIDKVFPLDDVVEALRYYAEGKTKGKIVIRMEEE